jgi:hypothetical protein
LEELHRRAAEEPGLCDVSAEEAHVRAQQSELVARVGAVAAVDLRRYAADNAGPALSVLLPCSSHEYALLAVLTGLK